MTNSAVKNRESLSTAEAATLLGWSLSTTQRRIRAGVLPAQLIGGSYVIQRRDVEALLEQRTIESETGSDESDDQA